jgi:hypothetical protein
MYRNEVTLNGTITDTDDWIRIILQTEHNLQCLQNLIRYLIKHVSTLHGGHHQANIEV